MRSMRLILIDGFRQQIYTVKEIMHNNRLEHIQFKIPITP